MDEIRFLHAADLHLDSPFVGIRSTAPEAVRARLLSATFEAYEALVSLAIAERVDAVLIAGDVYDGADRSLRAQLAFVAGLERLSVAGIRSFICHGNHDPLDGWDAGLALPPLAHRFGPEVEAVPLDPANPGRATVYGISYATRQVHTNLVPRFIRDGQSRFAIGLLHANVGSDTGHESYAPCTIEDLARSGMDYWALGHVHTRQVLRPSGPVAVYPGNTQGRQPNETGAHGAYLVTVDGTGACRLDFRALDVARWEQIEVGLADARDFSHALELIDRAVGDAIEAADGRSLIYRLNLLGRTNLYDDLLHGSTLEDLQGSLNGEWAGRGQFAWCERIGHSLRPEFDREAALAGGDFLAELLAGVDAIRSDPADLAALQSALEPLYGSDRARKVLRELRPDGEALVQLLAAAENECIDRLQGVHA